jgi:rhomboid family GlyGly-CTERM serine protease
VGALAIAAPTSGTVLLCYHRAAIARGAVWRLLTTHLVHVGAAHALTDLAALLLVGAAFAARFSSAGWLAIAALSGLAVSGGVFLLDPDVERMAGASALAHALAAAGAAAALRAGDRWAALWLALLAAKVASEQLGGPVGPLSGRIAASAHLYGTIAGFVLGWTGKRAARDELGHPRNGVGRRPQDVEGRRQGRE